MILQSMNSIKIRSAVEMQAQINSLCEKRMKQILEEEAKDGFSITSRTHTSI